MTGDDAQVTGDGAPVTGDDAHIDETPRPVPRPGPPRPVPRPHPPVQPPPARSDPRKFGRVADDGTVYLVSSSGERVIGSWQTGEPEAAFDHFGRRFDDLATEITLMEARLTSGTGDARKIKAAAAAIGDTFGKTPIPVRGGGSIPICALFEKELNIKIVFMGFGLDSDNLHSPNEKYELFNFYKGIETIPHFHKRFAEMSRS